MSESDSKHMYWSEEETVSFLPLRSNGKKKMRNAVNRSHAAFVQSMTMYCEYVNKTINRGLGMYSVKY